MNTNNTLRPATLDDLVGDEILFQKISAMRAAVAAAKTDALMDLIESYEEAGEPVVVFSAHVDPVAFARTRPGWALIDGSVDAAERSLAVDAFQAGKLKGIAGTRAMVEGVTLTRASNMIFVDRFWNPGLNDQAEDRIHRIGQTASCLYRTLVADHPIDQLIADLLASKRETIERTVDASVKVAAPAHATAAPNRFAQLAETLPPARRAAPSTPPTAAAERAPGGLDRGPLAISDLSHERRVALALERAGISRGEPRAPVTAREIWACNGLQQLDGACDGAIAEDDVGFNAGDTHAGKYLGAFLRNGGLLDSVEWDGAIELCRTYQGQVGAMPEATDADRVKLEALRARVRAVSDISKIRPDVTIRYTSDNCMSVSTPYNAAATTDWRAIPGRRWTGAANVVSSDFRDVVYALLAKHFSGSVCADPEGIRVL